MVGVSGGQGGGNVAGGGVRLRCGGCWGGGGECSLEGRDPAGLLKRLSGGRTRRTSGGHFEPRTCCNSEASRLVLAAAASARDGCWLGDAGAASWVAGGAGGAASASGCEASDPSNVKYRGGISAYYPRKAYGCAQEGAKVYINQPARHHGPLALGLGGGFRPTGVLVQRWVESAGPGPGAQPREIF